MASEGAAIIDVGGESTRPGARAVSAQEEIDRVLPLIEALVPQLDVPLSIDTSKPEVMRVALQAGVGMINDVNALRAEAALEIGASARVPICLMHMLGTPRSMQRSPHYGSAIDEIYRFLEQRIAVCEAAGIGRERLIIDPGFGFGKTLEHNLELLAGLGRFRRLGVPVLAGLSRKSMLGTLTGRPVDERLAASVAAAVIAAERGAQILRVHDVRETVDALRVLAAVAEIGATPD
jgi:dihydropteroate synthase